MRLLKWLLGFSLIVVIFLTAGVGYCWHWLNTDSVDAVTDSPFNVKKGESLYAVAKNLKKHGLLQQPLIWRIYARFLDQAPIHAGEYQWQNSLTPIELLNLFQEGKVVHYRVTLVEGSTYKDFIATLHAQPKLQSLLTDVSPQAVLQALKMEEAHPEGWFYPDTYHFVAGDSDREILTRAYTKMKSVLAELWQQRAENLPYENAYQALIMASIVEKETGAPSEREQIAGVFVRRLQKGMRLQTDPTVIYGLGEAYVGNITRAHLRQATPYNTYVIKGLPPTPIANPGFAAIEAALNPAQGGALYFVAKGDGSHVFSDTLEQHNQAVNQYQKYQRSREYRSAPQ